MTEEKKRGFFAYAQNDFFIVTLFSFLSPFFLLSPWGTKSRRVSFLWDKRRRFFAIAQNDKKRGSEWQYCCLSPWGASRRVSFRL